MLYVCKLVYPLVFKIYLSIYLLVVFPTWYPSFVLMRLVEPRLIHVQSGLPHPPYLSQSLPSPLSSPLHPLSLTTIIHLKLLLHLTCSRKRLNKNWQYKKIKFALQEEDMINYGGKRLNQYNEDDFRFKVGFISSF